MSDRSTGQPITLKEIALAAEFLDDYSDFLGSRGCTDWGWPADWTPEERVRFVREYHDWNGDPEEFDPRWIRMENFCVARLLAAKLKALLSQEESRHV